MQGGRGAVEVGAPRGRGVGRPATADGVGGGGAGVGGEGMREWREETEDGGGTAVNVPASLPSANGRQTFFAVRLRTTKRWGRWAWVGYTITGPTNLFAVR